MRAFRYVVVETRRDGGAMEFLFDNEVLAKEQMEGLAIAHRERTYEFKVLSD